MNHIGITTLLLGMACISACDQTRTDPPVPRADSAGLPQTSSAPDPSVPAADALPKGAAGKTAQDEPTAPAGGALTKAQESSAMPMPGQVNNHSSTALDPGKRASAP